MKGAGVRTPASFRTHDPARSCPIACFTFAQPPRSRHAKGGSELHPEIARRTGRDRKTIRKAMRRTERPPFPPAVASKLDPHREQIAQLLRTVQGITNPRIRELITESGHEAGKTIVDDYPR